MTDHQYKEAFCLMLYRDTQGNEEVIWNSRNGVTPFTVQSKQGSMADHVEWYRDRCDPDYDPPIGSRVFVDQTEERAREQASVYVDKQWDQPVGSFTDIRKIFTTKEEAIQGLTKEWFRPGAPALLEVTEGLKQWLDKQRELRKKGAL